METFLQQHSEKMLNFIEKLVNIDSGSYNKKGVDQIGEILRNCYENLGFHVKVIPQKEYGNHLVIEHKESIYPSIVILAHMDTVFPKGTVLERAFRIEGQRAYGPGVIDMKSSHAAVLFAIKALINERDEAYKHIKIILNSEEEIGSPTSKSLIEKEAKNTKYALVMEPARKDGSLVSARRGKGNYTLIVEGKAAHSGIEPEKGRSAIEELAHKIIQLHELSDHENGISVNVGLIEGGSSANTVSDHAEAQIDVRMKEIDQVELIEGKLEEICSTTEVAGTKIVLEGEMNRPPMEKNKKTRALLRLIQAVGDEIGIEIEDTATGGGSDASFTSSLGIATIDGLGPIGGNAHSDKEYLEIPSLVERTYLLATIIKRLVEKQNM
ncbi:M20 family metallopeptidase [Metabacillus halosaccharovorans]|uniref:M20 family metallopeptidase n=1 Tax=Metabacillus halosaccharovorans TaxID=930124 RepID=A0ABT3DHB6_9BACI|nr:M20 family metallopeptidase [Metabacillus halosaccharovorans]MCV9885921.1 M20 family metallopeptidase [Metabacillus halosaccharovorans]